MFRKGKGFTLVELLVTVSIIGILSGLLLGVINVGGIRAKARDSTRVADLKKIQTALEAYLADHRVYPDSGSAWLNTADPTDPESIAFRADIFPDYLSNIPEDPSLTTTSYNPGPCSNDDRFRYNYKSDGSRYILTAIMEIDSSAEDSPCADLWNWSNYPPAPATPFGCSTYNTADVCYGVQNP